MKSVSSQREVFARFKEYINYKIAECLENLHATVDKQADFIKYVLKYKSFLIKEGFDITIFQRENIQVPIEVNLDKAKDLDPMLYAKIRSLNYLNIRRIPELRHKLKIYSTLKEIDFSSYLLILRYYNSEIGNQVLKGNKVSLGKYLSTLEVVHVYCNMCRKRDKINFVETNKLRRELEAKGIETYSKDNPNGVKYFIYYNTDEYYWFKWTKVRVKSNNRQIYQFEPSNSMNGPDIDKFSNGIPTKEDIFGSIYLGTAKKLMLIRKYYPSCFDNCSVINTRDRT